MEVNEIKENRGKGGAVGDDGVVSTVKSEHIKNLEDQLKAVDDNA